jgi:hypothetical protein
MEFGVNRTRSTNIAYQICEHDGKTKHEFMFGNYHEACLGMRVATVDRNVADLLREEFPPERLVHTF